MHAMPHFPPHPFDSNHVDRMREECAVFGIYGTSEAAAHCALGLHALQHRGQEGAGIVTFDAANASAPQFSIHTAFGKVGDNFNSAEVIASLPGSAAIGHNRYSTSGKDRQLANIQPLFAELSFGGIALAHNGNLTNAQTLRKQLVQKGSIFRTTMDTETVIHLMARSKAERVADRLVDGLRQVHGAYSLVALSAEGLIGVRDPLGVRPLMLGQLDDAWLLASETCAFDIIGAKHVRDIAPGEMVIITEEGVASHFPFTEPETPPRTPKFCIFEYVYFSKPDSYIEGKDVYETRKQMGRELATEHQVPADVVVPVPDSGVAAALGYAEAASIPFELGIIRNHYVGRTFIEPADHIRHLGVKLKHNANKAVLAGKRVVLVDDSIVRGTTSRKIVHMVREAGAKEVHMRISSPPTTGACFYGIDTPAKEKLLAYQMDIEKMADYIGVDTLGFLSVDALYRAVGEKNGRPAKSAYCDACFTGEYPIPLIDMQEQQAG